MNLPQLTRSATETLLANLLRNFARRRIPCRRDSRGQEATAEPFHRLARRAGFTLFLPGALYRKPLPARLYRSEHRVRDELAGQVRTAGSAVTGEQRLMQLRHALARHVARPTRWLLPGGNVWFPSRDEDYESIVSPDQLLGSKLPPGRSRPCGPRPASSAFPLDYAGHPATVLTVFEKKAIGIIKLSGRHHKIARDPVANSTCGQFGPREPD